MLVYALIEYNSDTFSEVIINIYQELGEANKAMDNYNDNEPGEYTAHVEEFELK